MNVKWDEYERRVAIWHSRDDAEEMQFVRLLEDGYDCQENDPERGFELFTEARDRACQLNEPWWILFFEAWRLTSLTSHVMDFSRALPLAKEIVTRIALAEFRNHEWWPSILNNVLYAYISTDPHGYKDQIETGFAYLDGEISDQPVDDRFVFNSRKTTYFINTERWEDAYAHATESLKLTICEDATPWHRAWILFDLCRISDRLCRINDLRKYSIRLTLISRDHPQLRRAHASGYCWQAVVEQADGNKQTAEELLSCGTKLLAQLFRNETTCAEPLSRYYERQGNIEKALSIRSTELCVVEQHGMLHRCCQIQIERCRLLKLIGKLTPSEIAAARYYVSRLFRPEVFSQELRRIDIQYAND